jgi:hypothetical protein
MATEYQLCDEEGMTVLGAATDVNFYLPGGVVGGPSPKSTLGDVGFRPDVALTAHGCYMLKDLNKHMGYVVRIKGDPVPEAGKIVDAHVEDHRPLAW